MTTVLFRFFLLVYGRTILVLQFFLSIYPSSYSILILCFFSQKSVLILNLEETNLAGQEKKIYSDLTFSKYNHIQNFEEKKLFQHFANLIKIRSTHLLPILDLIIPPLPDGGGGILFYLCSFVLPKYFSSHFSQHLLKAEI